MENNKNRIFIALNPPEVLKSDIAGLIDILQQNNKEIKWVKPDGFHLTLHFLGYLEEETIKKVKNMMAGISGTFGRMEFKIGGINAFPDLDNPRVIFLECEQEKGGLAVELQKELGRGLARLGIKIDKRIWTPHITLGRVKNNFQLSIFSPKADSPPANNYQLKERKFFIESFELMESRLSKEGAEYKELASFKL